MAYEQKDRVAAISPTFDQAQAAFRFRQPSIPNAQTSGEERNAPLQEARDVRAVRSERLEV